MGDRNAQTVENKARGKKRKADTNDADDIKPLEIDINAPEPASKKALRRAKRAKVTSATGRDTVNNTNLNKTKTENDGSGTVELKKRSPHGVWIGNLPFFVTKRDLHVFVTGDTEHAISSDQITRIHLPQGAPKPGSQFQNKGFAYIDFISAEVVDKALQLSEKLVSGRRVLIKNSKDFQGRPESASKRVELRNPSTKRIFVGNLGFDVTKEDLEQHFEICGPIHDVHMATFEDSGKCKGYGWVEFEQLSSAEAAMRGWLEVGDSSVSSEKENVDTDIDNPPKTKRRVWVNKIAGRKIRMEFAEDKATRYKKRFGKESRSEGVENEILEHKNPNAAIEQKGKIGLVDDGPPQVELSSKKPQEVKKSFAIRTGYTTSSIQKMTGAITEGQGTKVMFD